MYIAMTERTYLHKIHFLEDNFGTIMFAVSVISETSNVDVTSCQNAW